MGPKSHAKRPRQRDASDIQTAVVELPTKKQKTDYGREFLLEQINDELGRMHDVGDLDDYSASDAADDAPIFHDTVQWLWEAINQLGKSLRLPVVSKFILEYGAPRPLSECFIKGVYPIAAFNRYTTWIPSPIASDGMSCDFRGEGPNRTFSITLIPRLWEYAEASLRLWSDEPPTVTASGVSHSRMCVLTSGTALQHSDAEYAKVNKDRRLRKQIGGCASCGGTGSEMYAAIGTRCKSCNGHKQSA
jgi:hypothetical protein